MVNKVKCFFWRASNLILLRFYELARIGMKVSSICELCGSGIENDLHVLWSCDNTHWIWKMTNFFHAPEHGVYRSFADVWHAALVNFSKFHCVQFAYRAYRR